MPYPTVSPSAAMVSCSNAVAAEDKEGDDYKSNSEEGAAGRSVWRRRLALLLKLAVGIGLLAWLLRSDRLQLSRLGAIGLSRDVGELTALTLGAMVLPMVRWWWLLRVQRLYEPLWKVLILSWASSFAGLVLPGAAGSDVAKSYLILRRRPHARARAFSTVLADRFLGLYSLVFLGCLTIVWLVFPGKTGWPVRAMGAGVTAVFLGMTGVAGCLLFTRGRDVLLRVLPAGWREAWKESFELYWAGRRSLVGCFLLSGASSAMTFASFAVAGSLMGDDVSWSGSFVAGPLIVLANCLPITPGGLGAGEAASSELLGCFGSHRGAEVMIVVRLAGALLSLPGIAAFWFIPSPRRA